MQWHELRQTYPDQWVLVEALEAHTEADHRELDRLAVLETCSDGAAAFRRYREMHAMFPERELYFLHTSREKLDIRERTWLGVWSGHAAVAER